MRKKLTYAMIGGASGSFIGPIHRMAVQMDNLADLVAGCFSRDAEKNAATGVALEIDPARLYADGRALIEGERGKVDFLSSARRTTRITRSPDTRSNQAWTFSAKSLFRFRWRKRRSCRVLPRAAVGCSPFRLHTRATP
jgi:hypothetical protein